MTVDIEQLRRAKAEPPHLLTQISTLRGIPEFDCRDETLTYDVNVERWTDDPEAFIYIQQRCNPDSPIPYEPVMRLDVDAARELMVTLAAAINAAELQNKVKLGE